VAHRSAPRDVSTRSPLSPPSRLPDATPTSTAPPSPGRRNRVWVAVQLIVTAVILWFVGRGLVDQWRAFRNVPLAVHRQWGMILLSALMVLLTYLVLIETWRRIVVAWGDTLAFSDAASIWFVSNLVRYLPWNFVFQLGAYAELARRRRLSPAAATGAAVINVIVNIASGFVIAFVAGFSAVDKLSHGRAMIYLALVSLVFVGLLALPALLPLVLSIVKRVTGREIELATLPRRAIYISLAGNHVAWMLYGIAYRFLTIGVIGHAVGTVGDYIAVYAAAYVIGYLAIALPAGAGVREAVQINALPTLGMATAGQAAVIAVSARALLTVLEIVPGLFFLARGTRLRPQDPIPVDGSKP
jgi:hypothetical protein